MKWRLRESIAEQLKSLSGLFNVEATQKVLAPMACQLLRDDVARVRQVALEVRLPIRSFARQLSMQFKSQTLHLRGRRCQY